jgi:hypothetical protein
LRGLTVVEDNGFHEMKVNFCACPRPDDTSPTHWEQLLQVRLFPATWVQPETAFTFNVMRQFHVHSLASKK